MKITCKGDYALKAILELSLHFGEGPLQIHDLVKSTSAPQKFLQQVMLELKQGGFIESRRGKEGGYLLAKAPVEITVGDVIRFIDGSTDPISCLADDYKGCTDITRCLFRGIWRQVAKATSEIIDAVSFESLVRQVKQKRQVLEYMI
jgi:Rrf2 family protein